MSALLDVLKRVCSRLTYVGVEHYNALLTIINHKPHTSIERYKSNSLRVVTMVDDGLYFNFTAEFSIHGGARANLCVVTPDGMLYVINDVKHGSNVLRTVIPQAMHTLVTEAMHYVDIVNTNIEFKENYYTNIDVNNKYTGLDIKPLARGRGVTVYPRIGQLPSLLGDWLVATMDDDVEPVEVLVALTAARCAFRGVEVNSFEDVQRLTYKPQVYNDGEFMCINDTGTNLLWFTHAGRPVLLIDKGYSSVARCNIYAPFTQLDWLDEFCHIIAKKIHGRMNVVGQISQ